MNRYRTRRRQSPWIVRQFRRQPKPLWMVLVMHLAALGLALLVFALPHHVMPRSRASLGIVSSRDTLQQAAPEATQAPEDVQPVSAELPEATPAPTAEPARTGDFSAKFAGKFTAPGDLIYTDTTYISENLNISITEHYVNKIRFYIADIYVRDISCFRSGFAKGKYGRNITEDILKVAVREQSVLTINGDFYGIREGGVCVRNGELYYSDEVVREICVLYWDGRMECFSPEEFDCTREINNGAYQIWNFGPAMLDENGNPRSEFGELYEGIYGNQPRTALGYYEPGHYCFIVADGRSDDSRGMTMDQLGATAQNLGLKQLYNLDGGRTSQMAFGTAMVNNPVTGGRNCSDYLTIVDSVS